MHLTNRLAGAAGVVLVATCGLLPNASAMAPPGVGTTPCLARAGCGSSASAIPRPGIRSQHAHRVIDIPGRLFLTKTTTGDVQTIYSISGHRERQLTFPGDYCCVLRVSVLHGRLLVFPTADQVPPLAGGTIGLNGTHFRPLTTPDPTLNLIPTTWSPTGTRIAYLGWDESDPARRGLYTTRVDGSDLKRVTIRPGDLDDVPLDYSPDGRRLVFYRSAHPDPDPHTDGSLWVVNVDGSSAHPITGPATPPADWARWSPDGRRIVFASERTSPVGALWTVAPDGSHPMKLFSGTTRRFPISPVWSPDGDRVLFALDPNNDQFTHPANTIWTISRRGSSPRLVDDTPDFKSQLDWVPAARERSRHAPTPTWRNPS